MYLEKISVRNYRSISTVAMEPCQDFNVLIGRNSSGKSNILTSIEAFFSAAVPGIVNLAPSLGDEIDFHQNDLSHAIEIEARFRVSQSERSELLSALANERPQIRNLLDDIGSNVIIFVSITIVPPPKRYSYVKSILLYSETNKEGNRLFEIDEKAAAELFDNAREMRRADSSNQSLDRFRQLFDSDDYVNIKRDSSPTALDYYFRRFGDQIDPVLATQVRKLVNASAGYEEFMSSITQLSKTIGLEKFDFSTRAISAPIRTFSGEEKTVPSYAKSLLQRISATKILHFKERRVPIGSEEAKRLLSLKVRRGGTDILLRIQATVNELLGVKVDAFEGGAARRGETLAELDVDNFLIQANGSGIREALRIILDTELEKPQMLLVEEPEIHLHPALETSIMGYLREVSHRGVQVFITTHSTNFLDTGNFQNVFLVSKDESTKIAPLTLAEAEEKLPSELGIRLSSLFMYDQIVFVEGPSDEQIIRELARVLNINLGQLNVGFIQMRGVRNIGHYAAAEVVSFLTKRRVKLWFVVDSDEAESVHFARLKNDFGPSAKIHVLRRREIENYLLSSAANIAHISARKQSAGEAEFVAPSPAEFAAKLAECAEGLKNLAMWKRVIATARRPFFPEDDDKDVPETTAIMKERTKAAFARLQQAVSAASNDIDGLCDRVSADLEQNWSAEKLKIIPGSALLDAVYKRYGIRFDKMRDGVAVASHMEADEVDQEIRALLAELHR